MTSTDPAPPTTAILPAAPPEVCAFLYHEAALLDALELEAWLALYADDAIYWVPSQPGDNPTRDVSLVYDDRRRLAERVQRLTGGFAYAQSPPSRTCRIVGNARLLGELDGDLEVASQLIVAEVRRGAQVTYAAQVTHRLVPNGSAWQIRRKTVQLVNGHVPLGNLTFLL